MGRAAEARRFDGKAAVTTAGDLARLDGNATPFPLEAEAHRVRLAYEYDPHFVVSVSEVDPLPELTRRAILALID